MILLKRFAELYGGKIVIEQFKHSSNITTSLVNLLRKVARYFQFMIGVRWYLQKHSILRYWCIFESDGWRRARFRAKFSDSLNGGCNEVYNETGPSVAVRSLAVPYPCVSLPRWSGALLYQFSEST